MHFEPEPHEDEYAEAFDRRTVTIATCLKAFTSNKAQSGFEVIGIAPPGTCIGDIVCVFVMSQVALIIRKMQNRSNIHRLVGRAHLDFQRLNENLPFKGQLAWDQSIELVGEEQPIHWPATVSADMRTLQAITRATVGRIAYGQQGRQLQLMPDLQMEAELATFDTDFQRIDMSQQRSLEQDPHHVQFLRAPAIGIRNLGSTGYLSCILRILYHLKPVRKVS